jgi:hypothetical protein
VKRREGNYARGQANGRAKVPNSEISLILELHRTGLSAAEIARKFELPERTVRSWTAGERRG